MKTCRRPVSLLLCVLGAGIYLLVLVGNACMGNGFSHIAFFSQITPRVLQEWANSNNGSSSNSQIPPNLLDMKIRHHKDKLLSIWSKVKSIRGGANPYKVHFNGKKLAKPKSIPELLCQAKQMINFDTLHQTDEPFNRLGFGQLFPQHPLNVSFGNYNSCAVVSNAGALYRSGLGKEIDTHDAVIRFNHAPTIGYTADVGSKTTLRLLNNQIISKPEFKFFESPLFKNVIMMIWDSGNYDGNLEEWYEHPDWDLFTPYWKHRERFPSEKLYIAHPKFLWSSWDFVQSNTPVDIKKTPPSSGFLGIMLMLRHCKMVDVYEYIPSLRITNKCHYFSSEIDPACTFGAWHPLAHEKLLVLRMNVASDREVFGRGRIRLHGIPTVSCS